MHKYEILWESKNILLIISLYIFCNLDYIFIIFYVKIEKKIFLYSSFQKTIILSPVVFDGLAYIIPQISWKIVTNI